MYIFLDYCFVVFHSSLVVFILAGWAWKPTRIFHLIAISLTLLSWFGLGIFFGWGYCPCTHWHWLVKYRLGETGLPYSYMKYYLDQITGMAWNPQLVNTAVVGLGTLAFVLSCGFNLRDRRVKRLKHQSNPRPTRVMPPDGKDVR